MEILKTHKERRPIGEPATGEALIEAGVTEAKSTKVTPLSLFQVTRLAIR